MPKLIELEKLGQSVWFDFIRRSLITTGEFQTLIDKGVRGITSNPAIFEKAIAGSNDYDEAIKELIKTEKSIDEIYESLAIEDISMAADLLKPIYDSSNGMDGYVSLEVNPHLANETEKTIAEARRLFETLNRPNVMIKVPATAAGIPAITELIGAGVNVNVTLIFGLENYKAVADAYLAGLDKLLPSGPSVKGGHAVNRVASVASFFVSRVDSAVDKALEEANAKELQGKIAIANSKVAYAEFKKIFNGPRWEELKNRGAREQRVLWASTSAKNPDYPDTIYVDELIGPQTVNTLPPATVDSFIDHGKAAETLTRGVDEAHRQIEKLKSLGIDLNSITQKLQEDGVIAFAKPFDALMQSLAEKRDRLVQQGAQGREQRA
ncbi:Transaldolase (EC [Olavius sp. associated proteobacterium Delta 1]|nr:Transaldolase (EC [Olavius sp. associated proteobacterium Delta 1]